MGYNDKSFIMQIDKETEQLMKEIQDGISGGIIEKVEEIKFALSSLKEADPQIEKMVRMLEKTQSKIHDLTDNLEGYNDDININNEDTKKRLEDIEAELKKTYDLIISLSYFIEECENNENKTQILLTEMKNDIIDDINKAKPQTELQQLQDSISVITEQVNISDDKINLSKSVIDDTYNQVNQMPTLVKNELESLSKDIIDFIDRLNKSMDKNAQNNQKHIESYERDSNTIQKSITEMKNKLDNLSNKVKSIDSIQQNLLNKTTSTIELLDKIKTSQEDYYAHINQKVDDLFKGIFTLTEQGNAIQDTLLCLQNAQQEESLKNQILHTLVEELVTIQKQTIDMMEQDKAESLMRYEELKELITAKRRLFGGLLK